MTTRPTSFTGSLRGLELAAVRMIEAHHAGIMLSSSGFSDDPHSNWDVLAGIGVEDSITIPFDDFNGDPVGRLQTFIGKEKGWCFFHISYDVKNAIEQLRSGNADRIGFPELVAFRPKAVIGVKDGKITTEGEESIFSSVIRMAVYHHGDDPIMASAPVPVQATITRKGYLEALQEISRHIHRGDIYEMNYCQEFFGYVDKGFDPTDVWMRLSAQSPAPFSAYYRWGHHVLVSASPERFVQKSGTRLISQPMKGTIGRGATPEEDRALKQKLFADPKERSENVMIVDLVRNDLSRIAARGSVKVDELYGIYTFPKVHQMISTVSAEVPSGITVPEVLRAAFPMGSMTGAPKIRAMQLIEQFEQTRRGLFSGSVGYCTPTGDFDMNVVIRSILINQEKGVLSFQTGGAITAASDPMAEYGESMLKANGLMKVLDPTYLT